MSDRNISFHLPDAEATTAIARRLAPMLRAGDVILLTGDVGAGKTHFARGVIQALLRTPEDIPSPTFTLVQTYEAESAEIWHCDLYRITSTFELEELGLVDAFENAVCLIEWPDRLGCLTPPTALNVAISTGEHEDARDFTLRWQDPSWDDRIHALATPDHPS